MTSDIEALRHRAVELGVEVSYRDVSGTLHHASESTLRAVVDVLEADRAGPPRQVEPVIVVRDGAVPVSVGGPRDVELVLADGAAMALVPEAGERGGSGVVRLPPALPVGCHELRAGEERSTVVVAPARMPCDESLSGGTGLFVPTYALWELDDPLPSFAHLAALTERAPSLGVDMVATLPLYAGCFDDPFDPSPYAPFSRLHWNEVLLHDAGLPEAPTVALLEADLLDWRALAARRRGQLVAVAADLDPAIAAALVEFTAARPDVVDFARFRSAGDTSGHPAALVERSHVLAQYLCHEQLRAVERPGSAVLALDLPIGSHPRGYESSAYADVFAPAMAVGAPPDEIFAGGQNWGFPPQLPATGRRRGHDLWRALVARAGEHSSMVRIDHVMGVQRLWWIPDGNDATDGVYVRYPREELLAVIAAVADTTATTIVGENLGTVSEEVRDALERWEMIGLYEEQFELVRRGERASRPLDPVPTRSVAGIRTHDMPAFAAAVTEAREEHGPAATDAYRHQLEHAVAHAVADEADALLDGALERLAASDAYVVIVDLDDLVGETEPHNVPGHVMPTTWRRRLRQPMSTVLAQDEVGRRLALVGERHHHRGGTP